MHIEFSKIFDKFSKKPLMEVAGGSRPEAAGGRLAAADSD